MNVPQSNLDQWALQLLEVNGRLQQVKDALERHRTQEAADLIEQARTLAWTVKRGLEASGAEVPQYALAKAAVGWEEPLLPIEQMDTPANRRLLRALEEAAEAGLQVDRERGWDAGWYDGLAEHAATVRSEIFGPETGER